MNIVKPNKRIEGGKFEQLEFFLILMAFMQHLMALFLFLDLVLLPICNFLKKKVKEWIHF